MRRRTFSGVLVSFRANALDAIWIAAALAISVAATLIPARPPASSRRYSALRVAPGFSALRPPRLFLGKIGVAFSL
jgi:hypothetical protein